MPQLGFLFPAFNDRSTDLHSTLYYSKDSDDLHDAFIEQMLGCPLPLPAGYQKESFQTIIEETLGDACDYETVKTIHENLSELMNLNHSSWTNIRSAIFWKTVGLKKNSLLLLIRASMKLQAKKLPSTQATLQTPAPSRSRPRMSSSRLIRTALT